MESRKRIGLYGSGEVPRSRRLMSRSVGPRSKGLRDLADLPKIKRVRTARLTEAVAAAGVMMIAPLATVVAIVMAVVLATSMVPKNVMVEAPEPQPYSLYGFVFDSGGIPVLNCPVNVTNLANGQYIVTTSDPEFGAYIINLKPISGDVEPAPGTVFRITATLGLDVGVNETATPDPVGAGFWMNVTLGTVIPEFGELVLPIVGMIGMFAIVAVRARSKKDE